MSTAQTRLLLPALLVLAACGASMRPLGTTTGEGAASTEAAPSTAPEAEAACQELPAGPLPTHHHAIATGEDFDFDADGRLVSADRGRLVGAGADGAVEVLADGLDTGTTALRVLDDGAVVAASSAGDLREADPLTGEVRALLNTLRGPTALEVDEGLVYVADASPARVVSYDLATGDLVEVASGFTRIGGLVVDPSGDRLFVADADGVYVLEAADGAWGASELLFDEGDSYEAVEIDTCGLLYVLGASGELHRVDPETGEAERVARLDGAGWTSLRWGSDRGEWDRDLLYAADGVGVVAVETGVLGRAQPVDAAP